MICTGLILSLYCALNRLWCVLSDISGYVPLLAVLCISICSNCENPPQDESHGMIKVKRTYRSNLWVVLTRLSHMLVETSNPGCVTEATLVNRAWGCECVFVCLCVCGFWLCLSLQVLSPTYKQRNEDFRKLFKQLPDTERLIVGECTRWGHLSTGRVQPAW